MLYIYVKYMLYNTLEGFAGYKTDEILAKLKLWKILYELNENSTINQITLYSFQIIVISYFPFKKNSFVISHMFLIFFLFVIFLRSPPIL